MSNKKVVCPRGSEAAIIRRASEMYKKYLNRLKELRAQRGKGRIADFKDLNPVD
jgi:hypothetical protein